MRGVRRAYVPHRMEKLLTGQEAKEGLLRIPRQPRDHLRLMSYCSQSLHIWPQQALREMRSLPSARSFAECRNTSTRQRDSLPNAALGKAGTRQRPSLPSAKHSSNAVFVECQTLGKEGHSANVLFAECQALGKE